MDSKDFIGEFREFRGEMKEFKDSAQNDLTELRKEVRGLNNFKWRVAGGSALLCLVLTAAAQVAEIWVLKK